MAKLSMKVCKLDKTPICELLDNTAQRARNINESFAINEVTTLSFDLPVVKNGKWKNVSNETLIFFNDEYYNVKSLQFTHSKEGQLLLHVEAKHLSEILASQLISIEETAPKNIIELLKIALLYDENGVSQTGWTIGNIDVDKVKTRGLEANEQSPFSIILTIVEKWDAIAIFDSKTMKVNVIPSKSTEHPSLDLRVSKNLQEVTVKYDTSEICTRLYGYGGQDESGNDLDIMSVNPTGKPYVDNFDYFVNKGYTLEYIEENPQMFVRTNIYREDTIYDPQDLYDNTVAELEKVSQPKVEVTIQALNTTHIRSNNIVNVGLGDCVLVHDEDLGMSFVCNVIKKSVDYENPHLLNVELVNAIQYRDIIAELFNSVNNVSSIVHSGNLVGGVDMDEVKDYLNLYYLTLEQLDAQYARIETLETDYLTAEYIKANYLDAQSIGAEYASIGRLEAVEAEIKDLDVDTLNAKLAEVEELIADSAELNKLIATQAEIEELKAGDVTIAGKLKGTDAEIENIKATYVQVGSFEAYKSTVEKLFVTYEEVANLKAEYINALKLETDVAKITQLEAAIAKITTLEATLANVEKLVSKTVITDDLTASQATINSLDVKLADIETAIIDIAKIEDLEAVNAQIENLNATYINAVQADIDSLNAKSATIEQLTAYTLRSEFGEFQNLTTENLNATNADIGALNANVGNIQSVLAGNVGTGLLQTVHLTAENVVIDDAVIKSANIESIDTDIVTVGNDNIILSGSTQQFKDANGNIRVQIGQDAEGNFSFVIADQDGATVIDANGVTENAIPDGLIVDPMVSDNANIQASKIQYITTDGNTTLQTHLETEQGRINALIKETTIDNEDGTTTSLKDKYLDINATVDGMQTTITDVSTDMKTINTKITKIETTADGIYSKVSSIGGQNLFYACSKEWVDKTDGEDYIYVGCYREETDNDMEGEYVTLSIEIKTDSTTSGTFDICYYDVNAPTINDITTLHDNIPLTELVDGKYIKTFIYPETSALIANQDGSMPVFTMVIKVSNITGTFSIRKGMLQYGKLATEWQPSSDNISDSVSIANQEAGKISWLVKSGSDKTNFELTPRTASLIADEINLNGLVTFNGLDSSTQNKINTGGTLAEKTKTMGIELFDRRYESDISCTPFIFGEHEIVPATEVSGGTESDANLVKITDYQTLYTDFIPWSFNSNPFYCSADVYYPSTTDGTVYIQVGFFDDEQKPIGNNNGYNLNLIRNATITSINTWQTLTFNVNTLITSTDDVPRKLAKYIRFRYLARYSGYTGVAYLRNLVIKQLSPTVLSSIATDWSRWTSEAVHSGTTTINGGYIQAETIGADQIAVRSFFANQAVVDELYSKKINADNIDAGTVNADHISLYGMTVKQTNNNVETFRIDESGDVTLRGTIESYNYRAGKSGWSIKSSGDTELNDIVARGSMITNDGGIVSTGGSGVNLQRDTSFPNDNFGDYWRAGNAFSVDTNFLYDNVNTVKYSRSGLTADDVMYCYTKISTHIITPTVGEPYTASANFYVKNLSKIDGVQPIIGIWFYNSAGVSVQVERMTIPFVENTWVKAEITSICPAEAAMVAIVIGGYRNGEFWFAQPKLEQGDIATSWSLAPADGIRQIVMYAGETYSGRANAPFIVYNDGYMKVKYGEFGGVFSGDVKIGNITITDPSDVSGNDAILTIQHGGNGIKRVQLRDTTVSNFAQEVRISDNQYNQMIALQQNGYGIFATGVKVGDSATNSLLNEDSLTLNGSIIDGSTNNVIKILPTRLDVGSTSLKTTLDVYGDTTMKSDLTIEGEMMIGTKLKISSVSKGVDIDFVG